MPNPPAPPHLVTFGRLALIGSDGGALVSADSAKLLALLAYLAASPGRRATRDRLIDLFWADSPVDKARNSLRQNLHKLRAALGDELLPNDGTADIVLAPSLTTDRDAFLAALDRGDIEGALAWYTGPFAPGIVSAGSAGFEHWADNERDRLHDLFAAAAETVGRRMLVSGDPRGAHTLALRLLEIHPLDENAWRLRLETETATGSRVHLAASIAELKRRFAEEGEELQPRTRDLVRSLSRPTETGAETSSVPSLVADLVGRQTEFTSLFTAWRTTVHGRGSHLHITGAPGQGKTRLLEDFAKRLGAETACVVTVRATPRQRGVTASILGGLVSALAELPGSSGISPESAAILIELQPAIGGRFSSAPRAGTSDSSDRDRVRTEALCDLLSAVVNERPVTLLLDDMHWWDPCSRNVIANVIERITQHHVLVVTASRPGEGEIRTSASHPGIELAPLDRDAIRDLVLSLGECDTPAAVDGLALGLHRATGGVPLLVLEALRLGLDRGQLRLEGERWAFTQLDRFIKELHPDSLLGERLRGLSSAQRDLLLMAALAEHPVTAAEFGSSAEEASSDDLVELERHGLLRPSSAGWTVAHDTIAESVIGLATPEQRKRAHQRLGEYQLRGEADQSGLRIAMEHFCEAEDIDQQRVVALSWLSRRRADGDDRPTKVLLADLLGPYGSEGKVRELAAGLPPSIRLSSWPHPRVIAASAVLVLGLAAASFAWRRSDPAGAEYTMLEVGRDSVTREHSLEFRLADWEGRRGRAPLRFSSLQTSSWQVARDSLSGYPVPEPSGSRWVFVRRLAESDPDGPSQLFLRGPDGDHRIVPASGDDVDPSWAPDGSAIVFGTTRYPDGGGTFDLAIADLRTGEVRRLTKTRDAEWYANWSPDGSRIAFIRKFEKLAPDELCWITVDSRVEHCRSIPGFDMSGLPGWIDQETLLVLVRATAGGVTRLHRVNLHTGADELLSPEAVDRADLSPDGHWVVASTKAGGNTTTQRRLIAFAVDQPSRVRSAILNDDSYTLWFWRNVSGAIPVESLVIRLDRDTLFVPGPIQLSVEGRSKSGEIVEVPPEALQWATSDSSIASIDEAGRLQLHRDGLVTISVTSGGWRRASVTRTVVSGAVREVLHEVWDTHWDARWKLYGDPLPYLTTADDGTRSLYPNGDDKYSSGAYSANQFDATHGLAIEVQLRTPITRSWWQTLTVKLFAMNDGVGRDGNRDGEGCGFKYPATEGGRSIGMAGVDGEDVAVDPTLGTGRWFRVRVQYFPDGTCGVALNGRVLFHGNNRHPSTQKFNAKFDGQTFQGQLLVGPLTVWQGVPPGVDWSAKPDSH